MLFIFCIQIGLQVDCLKDDLKYNKVSVHKTLEHIHRSHVKLLELNSLKRFQRKYWIKWVFFRFKNSVEHIFKLLNFIQCGQSILYMCLFLYVSQMETDGSRKLQVLAFSLASSFQLIFICFVGQHLTNKFDELFHSVYDIDWYNFNKKDKKAFLLMITMMQKPVSVKTYFNSELSAVSFASVSFWNFLFWRDFWKYLCFVVTDFE